MRRAAEEIIAWLIALATILIALTMATAAQGQMTYPSKIEPGEVKFLPGGAIARNWGERKPSWIDPEAYIGYRDLNRYRKKINKPIYRLSKTLTLQARQIARGSRETPRRYHGRTATLILRELPQEVPETIRYAASLFAKKKLTEKLIDVGLATRRDGALVVRLGRRYGGGTSGSSPRWQYCPGIGWRYF